MPKFKNSNATFWVIFKHCASGILLSFASEIVKVLSSPTIPDWNERIISPALIRKWPPFNYTNPRHDISAFFSDNFYLNETTRERCETETNLNSFRLSKRFFNSKIVSLFSLENQQDLHSVEKVQLKRNFLGFETLLEKKLDF